MKAMSKLEGWLIRGKFLERLRLSVTTSTVGGMAAALSLAAALALPVAGKCIQQEVAPDHFDGLDSHRQAIGRLHRPVEAAHRVARTSHQKGHRRASVRATLKTKSQT
jgi:hypothetical protein